MILLLGLKFLFLHLCFIYLFKSRKSLEFYKSNYFNFLYSLVNIFSYSIIPRWLNSFLIFEKSCLGILGSVESTQSCIFGNLGNYLKFLVTMGNFRFFRLFELPFDCREFRIYFELFSNHKLYIRKLGQ